MTSRVIFWDIDGTLLPTSLERLFIRQLRTLGYVSLPRILAQASQLSLTWPPLRWHNVKLCYLRGLEAELVDNLASNCWREVIKPRLRSRLVDVIGEFRERGMPQVLLTGTPRFLAAPLAHFLTTEHLIAAEPEVSGGMLTGGLRYPHPYGKRKVTAAASWLAKHGYHWAQAVAVANSWADRHLLLKAGKAVVVDPGYLLRREARRRSWTQLSPESDCKKMVSLIDADT